MRHWGNVLIAVAVLATTSACAPITRKVVAEAEGYSDLYSGDVVMDLSNGTATISISNTQSKVSCTGAANITRYGPSMFSCAGQGGVFRTSCTDGREVRGTYEVETCESGYGSGRDQLGNRFSFAFGLNDKQAEDLVRAKGSLRAELPKLPVYRPKEVRKERGFSTGTGFLISSDGVLITNYHVVEGSTEIVVAKQGREPVAARFLLGDPANDIALLKIEGSHKPVRIRSDGRAEKGQEVFTLGYPLIQLQGQEQKATFGRINALSGIKDDVRFMQVDVPIQPGNSGGPLFDLTGQVVGVATATLDQFVALRASGTLPQNVNYAVKVDYAIPVARKFLEGQSLPPLTSNRAVTELIRELEESVVLVVAK